MFVGEGVWFIQTNLVPEWSIVVTFFSSALIYIPNTLFVSICLFTAILIIFLLLVDGKWDLLRSYGIDDDFSMICGVLCHVHKVQLHNKKNEKRSRDSLGVGVMQPD